MRTCLLLWLIGLCIQQLPAQSYTWEIDRRKADKEEQKKLDSLALANKKFLYRSQFYLKTEFPIQAGIGYQHIAPSGLAFHGSVGLYPKAFSTLLINLAPEETLDPQLAEFIQDRARNGSVIELGMGYYHLKSGFFSLLGVQFQRYGFSATMDELVQSLEVDVAANNADFEELLNSSQPISDFYYREMLYPTFRNTNLVLSVGKLFRFSAIPQLSISTAMAYSLSLDSSFSVEANSTIGRIVTSNVINPILTENMPQNGVRGLPTLSLTVNYHFGEIIR